MCIENKGISNDYAFQYDIRVIVDVRYEYAFVGTQSDNSKTYLFLGGY